MNYDIVVIGGGMAGCAAAVSAARSGASVLLIESSGYLGGWATAALVNPFMTHKTSTGVSLISGLFDEIRSILSSSGGLFYNCFDPEVMKNVLQDIVLESGVKLRLHTFFANTCYDGSFISVKTISKSKHEQFRCKRLIDCSGDGDAAVSLGAKFKAGDDEGLTQAATLMFDVGGVDLVQAMDYVRSHPEQMLFPKLEPSANPEDLSQGIISVAGYYDIVAQAKKRGEYDVPGDLIFYLGRPHKGEVTFNTTHIGYVNGTNAEDLTRAEIEGRIQMMSVISLLKKYVPGFQNCYLLRSADHVGIRETRRIMGDYVFSASDVAKAAKFKDSVCRLAYPVDVHSGKGGGYTKEDECTGYQAPPAGDWYEIPYRCLLPEGLDNVLIAGRCISSTQGGHGAVRIMPACVAMGQAAGTAAALSIPNNISPRDLDFDILHHELIKQGALL